MNRHPGESELFLGAHFRWCRVIDDPNMGHVLIKRSVTSEVEHRFRSMLAGERLTLKLLQGVPGCPRLR